jgi:hypothetical protein
MLSFARELGLKRAILLSASGGGILVELSPHHPKVEGLSPATAYGTLRLYHKTFYLIYFI